MSKIENPFESTKAFSYQAPMVYVGVFYSALVAWGVVSVSSMASKGWVNWMQLFMVAFVFVLTWYFSLGISYRIKVDEKGEIELASLRRRLRVRSSHVVMIEGPHLPLGFIRFRLEREKAYLFGIPKNADLQQTLSVIRKANPDIRFKNLTLNTRNRI